MSKLFFHRGNLVLAITWEREEGGRLGAGEEVTADSKIG